MMNPWLRRLLIALFLLFWLAVLLTPTVAIIVARNGQLQLGRTEGPHWRLFLVQGGDAEGLGLERSRSIPPPLDAPPSVRCLRTSVNYWLWMGAGFAADYCQCTDTATGDMTDHAPPVCAVP